MAKIPLKNYLWLIDKLSKRPMTFAEICDSYERSSLFERNHPLQARTLYNWREKIDELFGIQIKYNNETYRMENYESLDDNSPQKWLIQSISVNDIVARSRNLQSRILLEDIPSGNELLTDLIEAMEESKVVKISYQRFSDASAKDPIKAEPYCVKVNNRRWYVLCHVLNQPTPETTSKEYKKFGCLKIYALDRIQELEITDEKFSFPKNFYPDEFFANHFGVCIGYDIPIQKVKLRVSDEHRMYLRTLPLHHSQKEIETKDDYSVFQYRLHPTIDFIRTILALGADTEVLEPLELREAIAEEIKTMNKYYKPRKKKD